MRKSYILSILGVIVLAMALVPHLTVEASKPVPVIVDKQSFLGQSGTLVSTTLFTPTVAGDYRISIILSSDDSSIQPVISWTDENGARSETLNINQQNGMYHRHATFLLHSAASNAISVAESGATTHDLFITVEEL